VQQVNPGSADGERQGGLLPQHAPWAAGGFDRQLDHRGPARPGLRAEGRGPLARGKEDELDPAALEQGGDQMHRIDLGAPGLAGHEVEQVEADLQGPQVRMNVRRLASS